MIDLSLTLLALMLGFKHSYDADHLIAVSSILRKVESLKSAIKVGFYWAVGHMATATLITVLLFIFREKVLNDMLPHFEKFVGIMLIVLGLISFKDAFKFHIHAHKHGKINHSHPHLHVKGEEQHFHNHMFGIGIIHGLASNDELLVLFTASLGITTIGGILLGVGIFSIGVVLGMVLFTSIFSIPLLKINSNNLYRFISFSIGSVSVGYGAFMALSLI